MMEGNRKLTIFVTILVVILVLAGWEVTEGEAAALDRMDSGAAIRSRLASVALEEYEENGGVMGGGKKYWTYWHKPVEQWCVDFVYYCGDQIGLVGDLKPFGTYTAGCLEAWNNLAQQGARMFAVGEADPQPGDLVFWYSTDSGCAADISNCTALRHVGIVVAYADGTMITVEGNSGGYGSLNNYVAQNVYKDLRGQSWPGAAIWGFARIQSSGSSLIELIKDFEGFSKYPFWDYSQFSVGYGTACPQEKYDEYMTYGISEAEACALLEHYVASAANAVDAYIRQNALSLTPEQRDALVSLTYNIGEGWMRSESYAALRRVVAAPRDELTVVQTFANISHAGGEILPGLVERRICEAHLFLTGEYITDYNKSAYGYTILRDRVIVFEKEAGHEHTMDR